MVTVPGGVQMIRQYAPLTAQALIATVAAGASVDIPLQGAIGNSAALTYEIANAPTLGQASLVNGSTLRYTAPPGGASAATLRYRVRYGRAVAEAGVDIEITGNLNHPPVAAADTAKFQGSLPVLIPVLANDSDPDGDPLTLVAVFGPTVGEVAIVGNQVRYTPGGINAETFSYTVSDGRGGTDQGEVSVSKAGRLGGAGLPVRRPLRQLPVRTH